MSPNDFLLRCVYGTYVNSWGEAQLWLIEGAGFQRRMFEFYLKINKMKLNFFP